MRVTFVPTAGLLLLKVRLRAAVSLSVTVMVSAVSPDFRAVPVGGVPMLMVKVSLASTTESSATAMVAVPVVAPEAMVTLLPVRAPVMSSAEAARAPLPASASGTTVSAETALSAVTVTVMSWPSVLVFASTESDRGFGV
ncbi:MAG: hypothetical protein MPJ82_06890, partial [Alphaproteobacteria bacterium]|nr:hypothetical protein [Alphaproteobacteria bacterium]